MHGFPSRRAKLVAAAAATLVLALPAVPAAAASSAPSPIGPNQYFTGLVHGTSPDGTASATIIGVACAGPASLGHPLPGQSVEVDEVFPPTGATIGNTGSLAKSITAYLVWAPVTTPPVSTTVSIGVLTTYETLLPIPTTLWVPCSGSGQAIFAPTPSSSTSKTSVVVVNFRSNGVTE